MIAASDTLYWGPSVSYQTNQQAPNSGYIIAHNVSTGGVAVQKLVSGTWLLPVSFQQNVEWLHPNLTDRAPQSNTLQACSYPYWYSLGSTYSQVTSTYECFQKSMSQSSMVCSREIVLQRDTTRMQYRIGELDILDDQNSTPLGWNTGFDTLVVGKTKQVDEYLRTETFTAPQGGRLRYRLTCNKKGFHAFASNMAFEFQVVDAASNQVLGALHQVSPHAYQNGRSDHRNNVSLNAFSGRRVYLQVVLQNYNASTKMQAIDYYHTPWTSLPKESPELESLEPAPTEYALSQNYPNPFNPSTQITFSLPEEGNVFMCVTNALGKTIATLVNGHKDSGTHSVVFDGSKYPSGIYYYRMTVNGKSLVRKMSLVK
jgi:hypothetical protein